MSYKIYILYSKKDGKLYVGCTSDLKQRLEEHTKGKVTATKHRRPLILIHTEEFTSREKAFKKNFLKAYGVQEKKVKY